MTIRANVERNDARWIWVQLTMEGSKAKERTYKRRGTYNMGCFQVMSEDKDDLDVLLQAIRETGNE